MPSRNSDHGVYLGFGEARLGNPVIDEVSCHTDDCCKDQQHHALKETASHELQWEEDYLYRQFNDSPYYSEWQEQ